jgi:hypothetical protein
VKVLRVKNTGSQKYVETSKSIHESA